MYHTYTHVSHVNTCMYHKYTHVSRTHCVSHGTHTHTHIHTLKYYFNATARNKNRGAATDPKAFATVAQHSSQSERDANILAFRFFVLFFFPPLLQFIINI
jgi:hypothetical protein